MGGLREVVCLRMTDGRHMLCLRVDWWKACGTSEAEQVEGIWHV
jgi:hypothetical protein